MRINRIQWKGAVARVSLWTSVISLLVLFSVLLLHNQINKRHSTAPARSNDKPLLKDNPPTSKSLQPTIIHQHTGPLKVNRWVSEVENHSPCFSWFQRHTEGLLVLINPQGTKQKAGWSSLETFAMRYVTLIQHVMCLKKNFNGSHMTPVKRKRSPTPIIMVSAALTQQRAALCWRWLYSAAPLLPLCHAQCVGSLCRTLYFDGGQTAALKHTATHAADVPSSLLHWLS